MRITTKKHFYVRFERTAYSCPNYALPLFGIDYRSRTPSISSILNRLRLEEKKKLRKNGIGSIFATKEINGESR